MAALDPGPVTESDSPVAPPLTRFRAWLRRPPHEPSATPPTTRSTYVTGAIVLGFSFAMTVAVFRTAWISEDAFITLRYVANALAGHGAVFNVGERVQGYTHPLWFLVLWAGSLVGASPVYLAIGYGLALTFAVVVLVGAAIRRLGLDPLGTAALLGLACVILVSSASWISFQTGGLENALAHALVAGLLVLTIPDGTSRSGLITLLMALLVLTRLDLGLLVAPLGVLVLLRVRDRRTAVRVALAVAPLAAWLLFAWAYYGDILPNTAHAKVDIYPSRQAAAEQGRMYLKDWLAHEPFAAGAAFVLFVTAALWTRTSWARAWAVGIALYVLFVVGIGGDFMRGRFWLPVFFSGVVFGTLALAARAPGWSSRRLALVTLGVAVAGLGIGPALAARDQPGLVIPPSGIVDERQYYPGYHLATYREVGRFVNPYLNLEVADWLRRYAQRCGPVVIHARNPGALGYLAGPDVSIIDMLGLTDRFIARLPKSHLVNEKPRPGHPDKRIPVWYLAQRDDISLIRGWEAAVARLDCEFRRRTGRYKTSADLYGPSTMLP
jgi:arabinofuranosyltransferase